MLRDGSKGNEEGNADWPSTERSGCQMVVERGARRFHVRSSSIISFFVAALLHSNRRPWDIHGRRRRSFILLSTGVGCDKRFSDNCTWQVFPRGVSNRSVSQGVVLVRFLNLVLGSLFDLSRHHWVQLFSSTYSYVEAYVCWFREFEPESQRRQFKYTAYKYLIFERDGEPSRTESMFDGRKLGVGRLKNYSEKLNSTTEEDIIYNCVCVVITFTSLIDTNLVSLPILLAVSRTFALSRLRIWSR